MMKFYDSLGPNPRLVRMFFHEKGIGIPERVQVDIMKGENRQEPYLRKNPAGQLPALELEDGTTIAETVAICEYLEDIRPEPHRIGSSPRARAITRMWTRRVEDKITRPLTDGFRFAEGLAMFKDRVHVIPQAADDLKQIAAEGLAWLDGQMEGRTWVAGAEFSLADVLLYAFLDFGVGVGQPLPDELERIGAWMERVAKRPSAEASIHPAARAAGMRA